MTPDFRLLLLDGDALPEAPPKEDLRVLERAARLDPHDADYFFILGQALLREGRFAEAARACREAVGLDGAQPDYHCTLGAALFGLERWEEAEGAFREAVRLRPDPRALNGQACALTRLHREREAVAVFHEALRQDGRVPEVHGNLGVALWAHRRTADAVRAFRTAVRLGPGRRDLLRNLGLALAASGNQADALTVLRQVAELHPARAEARLDLAEVLHALGRDAEAETALEEAVHLDAAALVSRPRTQEVRDRLRLRRLNLEPGGGRAGAPPPAGSRRGWRPPRLRLGALALLAALLLAVHAVARIGPVLAARYLLEDDVAGIAGAPLGDDREVMERLLHAVEGRGLSAHVTASSFEIRTRPKWRRITCRYAVPVALLPGLVHTFRFSIDVEKPYLLQPDTLFL